MGCGSCGSSVNGVPAGCKSNGHCVSGGCNKMNTFDWLADLPVFGDQAFDVVEVSFNKGARKEFCRLRKGVATDTGDWVAVEVKFGYDIGRITLSGELVKLQMRKKRVKDDDRIPAIIRKASDRDLERYDEVKAREQDFMVQSRAIVRSLNLAMKVGMVEIQGDGKKTTFYYTADTRIDFRELIKEYARVFKTKIEMRQIGARQEAGKIGGLGSCGRELCCSTWLTDFKTVSTSAARYQQLAINQGKLSGQCGRLKCCLNYELDTYLDALQEFPKKADVLKTKQGDAYLQKTDIFKREMCYAYPGQMRYYKLDLDRVKEILTLNANKEYPETLELEVEEEVPIEKYEDTHNVISLETLERADKRRKRKNKKRKQKGGDAPRPQQSGPKPQPGTGAAPKEKDPNQPRSDRKRGRGKGRGPKPGGQNPES